MKKIILTLVAVCLFASLPFTAFASGIETIGAEDSFITYLDDGSYYVETIIDTPEISNISPISLQTATKSSKTGTKSFTYYSADDVAQWKATVTGTFTYDGTTSTCTNSSHSVTIYISSWYKHSGSAYKSDNKAIADITMKRKFLGVVSFTKSVNITLSCDKNGKLS